MSNMLLPSPSLVLKTRRLEVNSNTQCDFPKAMAKNDDTEYFPLYASRQKHPLFKLVEGYKDFRVSQSLVS